MDYRKFSATDLASDHSFIEWVQRPDASSTAFWETFLTQHPEQADVLTTARHLVTGWCINSTSLPINTMSDVWKGVQSELKTTDRAAIRVGQRLANRPGVARYAAVFLALVLLSATFMWFLNHTDSTPIYYATQSGETKTITLPDRSEVVLAANSSVTVLGDWAPALHGKAYFSVTHQKNNQKFTVVTAGNIRVEVLGTQFTISEQPNRTQVVLNTGKVALYLDRNTQPVLMRPGDLVNVLKNQKKPVVRRTVKPEVYSAWAANQFVFEDTSLREIAAIIEREFDRKLVFADSSLQEKRITLRLPSRDLDLLLASLAEIHDLKVEQQRNQILLTQYPSLR